MPTLWSLRFDADFATEPDGDLDLAAPGREIALALASGLQSRGTGTLQSADEGFGQRWSFHLRIERVDFFCSLTRDAQWVLSTSPYIRGGSGLQASKGALEHVRLREGLLQVLGSDVRFRNWCWVMSPAAYLEQGDITKLAVDAIVNAANTSLLGGGGVDGAIHRAAGSELLEECQAIRARQGKCATGQAVITGAGKLPARHVIHAVGPVWNGGNSNEDELLASAYRHSLQLAVKHAARSIAFPNISTGIYGFPKERAALIALREVAAFFEAQSPELEVTFVCLEEENHRIYSRLFREEPAD